MEHWRAGGFGEITSMAWHGMAQRGRAERPVGRMVSSLVLLERIISPFANMQHDSNNKYWHANKTKKGAKASDASTPGTTSALVESPSQCSQMVHVRSKMLHCRSIYD